MNEIKIFFIIIGTFFMREQPSLVAEKATVHIDPATKTVQIVQNNVISTTDITDVSKTEEFLKLKNKELNWVKALDSLKDKSYELVEEQGSVSIKLRFTYSDPKDLEVLTITHNNGEFAVFNEENLEVIEGNPTDKAPYLMFKDNAVFSFTVSIFKEWLEPGAEKHQFNSAYLNQPLVAKKSDDIKGKAFAEIDKAQYNKNVPIHLDAGSRLFFSEDQNFMLLNSEDEIDVKFLDNNVVLISIKKLETAVPWLKVGENYFVFEVDEFETKMNLSPSNEKGTILKDKAPIYFSLFEE